MSQENATKEQSPAATLFQKTHAKMLTLQRIDEQFAALSAQRRKLQEELRALQGEINGELDRMIETPAEAGESGSIRSIRMQSVAA